MEQMIPDFYQRKIKTLAIDCTEHCNARCVFCFNDWRRLKPAEMDTEDFKKILPLISLTEKDGFYLSCLFEPTVNPQFFEMLKMLPAGAREHTYFTTNLVRPLSDQELATMCRANVDHINISLETFNPSLYSVLSGTRKSAFYDNLERLGRTAQNPRRSGAGTGD
jgi:molybdenum cofactor biosynthesis enzyme MoaA